MSSPIKPWESNRLRNSTPVVNHSNGSNIPRPQNNGKIAPALPPRPQSNAFSPYNSYMPYSGVGGYGGYSSYGSYGMPYQSSMYNSYGLGSSGYGGYNNYGMYGGYPNYAADDTERRFIQYAEESSRNTFASVESIVRAFNSLAMMLDNTFFAMTSSFRAVLSVAENFGRLRSMFGHIWYSVNVFRFLNWVYRKLRQKLGYKVTSTSASVAWKEAVNGAVTSDSSEAIAPSTGGSSWPTLAFLGVLVSAPYIISKFMPKYEDKSDPATWKSPGVRAKAVFDFVGNASNELTIHYNDIITLAPTYMQEEMNLKNSGWAFAVADGRSGVVPLNYLVINKSRATPPLSLQSEVVTVPKTHTKRVSFGENQIFENVDLDDYIKYQKDSSSQVTVSKEHLGVKAENATNDSSRKSEEATA